MLSGSLLNCCSFPVVKQMYFFMQSTGILDIAFVLKHVNAEVSVINPIYFPPVLRH